MYAFAGISRDVAPKRPEVAFCHAQRNPVGPKHAVETEVQASAERTRHSSPARRRLLHSSACERYVDEQLWRSAKVASTVTRARGRITRDGVGVHHVVSEDGKRVAKQLGDAVWGILDPNGPKEKNGSGVEAPKPLYLN